MILVLWALVVIAILAAGLAQTVKLNNAVRITAGDRVRARWLARAGVQKAIAVLVNDRGATDCYADSWYDNSELFRDQTNTDGTYSVVADRGISLEPVLYGAVDESSKLNINTATREAILALPNMTEFLVDQIIAARDNRNINFDELGDGTSSGDSQRRGFTTIRSLGQVPGVSESLLYGEDRNLNGILENNENDGDTMMPADNEDDMLDRGWLAYITVYSYEHNVDGEGAARVNINTANLAQLEDELDLTVNHAAWIVENRGNGFANIAEILDIEAEIDLRSVAEAGPEPQAQSEAGTEAESEDSSEAEIEAMPLDFVTFRRIADHITVDESETIAGRININTASLVVLQTLPQITLDLAENIIQRRQELSQGFTSIAELLTVPDMTIGIFREIAGLITVRSNVFTIRSLAQAQRTGLRHSVEAVVDRSTTPVRVLYWHETR
ncbi:MAG: helix-hairpin-helix domain-containing protein [Sedimentisphaerales bacterium]|nr:helix-hairpin-helix domain-containing protein [Sedimentisphaerales bacterium]